MLSKEFSDVNAQACTPQQQLNNFIAASLKDADLSDLSPLRYATVLTKLKDDIDAILYGKSDLRIQSQITEQLIRIESGDIKEVIETSCFATQGQALNEICTYGSLSSARLFGVSAESVFQPEPLDI